ncbi:AraC family transcriptional regulator [Paenibacillus massiliensis]|uniref:AraC family transcriptional regulator n=1 Tax=Paenibacillus massiliensis TaxID=225917 RepID=UPI00046FD4E5|nr:AraC family transcriptional regulator [Paenibacillus massiliensis]
MEPKEKRTVRLHFKSNSAGESTLKRIAMQWNRYSPFRAGHRGRYFRSNLTIVLVVSSIPGFIIGAMIYWMAGGRLESELLANHNRQIEQRAAYMNDQLTNLELMLAHWAFDPKFDYSLKGMDFTLNHERAWDITKTLVVMQGSSSMAKQVELYLSEEQPVLFNPEYGLVSSTAVVERYEKLMEQEQSTYWAQWAFDPNRPWEKDLTLIHHIPGGSQSPNGALLMRMDSEKVAAMLKTMMPYKNGETFLLRTKGDLFVSAGGSTEDAPFVSALRSAIQEQRASGSSSSFLFKWEDMTYAVTYGSFSRIAAEWLYVSASPITSITAPVIFISRLIFAVSSCALLLAAILSWFASRKIYSPVRRLMQTLMPEDAAAHARVDEFSVIEQRWLHLYGESHALQYTLSEQLPQVKESFLHQLFQGNMYAYSEQELRKRMERYHWSMDSCQLVVLYIQLTGISSLEGKFRDGDESLVSFAAVNIMGEMAAEHFHQAESIHFHDLTAGLLIMGTPEEQLLKQVQTFAEELTGAINRMLKMRVTIAFAAPTDRVSAVPLLFESVKQAASYRQFSGENQIINLEQMDRTGEAAPDSQYSFTLERGLIQALRMGEADEAYRLLEEFLEALCADGAKAIDVQQGMLHLLGSIQHAIMISGVHPNQLFKGANMYAALSQIHEPRLILDWFRSKVVAPFLKEMAERSDAGLRRTVEQVMAYMNENYMHNISLDSCADYTGTSPFVLSKWFKKVTGKNFIDYLTELRLDKAKELLRDTSLLINDVAVQVGYQHSYFNRIFKKQEGMTPTHYRKLYQQDSSESARQDGK